MVPGGTIPKHRLDALIDAVIAITMTLLVLELRIPELDDGDLYGALVALSPKIISWVVSFLILAIMWYGQTTSTRAVVRADSHFFRLTVLWLLLTSVIPFTSSLIGEHNELPLSHLLYAGNLIVVQVVVLMRDFHLTRALGLTESGEPALEAIDLAGSLGVMAAAATSAAIAYLNQSDYASLAYILTPVYSRIFMMAGLGGRRFHKDKHRP